MPNLLIDWPKLDVRDVDYIQWWLDRMPGARYADKSDAYHLMFTCKDSLKKAAKRYLHNYVQIGETSLTQPTYNKLWSK